MNKFIFLQYRRIRTKTVIVSSVKIWTVVNRAPTDTEGDVSCTQLPLNLVPGPVGAQSPVAECTIRCVAAMDARTITDAS